MTLLPLTPEELTALMLAAKSRHDEISRMADLDHAPAMKLALLRNQKLLASAGIKLKQQLTSLEVVEALANKY